MDVNTKVSRAVTQWKHNRSFLSFIPSDYTDWLITGTFYTAMHCVEAVLWLDDAPDHSKHGKRHRVLMDNPRYENIWPAYDVLYNLAHVTRYSAQPRIWVARESVEQRVFARALYPIESEVRRLLAAAGSPTLLPDAGPIQLPAGPNG